MKKMFPIGLLFVAAIVGAYTLGGRSVPAVHAQAQQSPLHCSIPKSYGAAKIGFMGVVGFEDAHGTVRLLELSSSGCRLAFVIERQ